MRYRDLLASPIRALWRPGWEAEAFEKRRILWRYQSGMFQIKGLDRAKLEPVVFTKKTCRVAVVVVVGHGTWSCVVVCSYCNIW